MITFHANDGNKTWNRNTLRGQQEREKKHVHRDENVENAIASDLYMRFVICFSPKTD